MFTHVPHVHYDTLHYNITGRGEWYTPTVLSSREIKPVSYVVSYIPHSLYVYNIYRGITSVALFK